MPVLRRFCVYGFAALLLCASACCALHWESSRVSRSFMHGGLDGFTVDPSQPRWTARSPYDVASPSLVSSVRLGVLVCSSSVRGTSSSAFDLPGGRVGCGGSTRATLQPV
ncbi:hypothetical protein PF005_g5582 [Phytophthora fragariae]|uniref:Secreted protein n=1 Tax=Phytophthora fragariae TaxID=53985 RepID=A0A6A3YYT1_9STRA|nr:hypothetical protein PF004_g12166 [Phytophthora fragariae]KAE9225261.1 hypothetical protein PF005_g5582 [Phytophthora fragariae]KAE9351644.1 hypothetical protein PF008_g5844 [Phytophthora fragariae]